MTSIRKFVYKDPARYKEFIRTFLDLLNDLSSDPKLVSSQSDPKFMSQLRLAERTFNFILDNFPPEHIKEQFGDLKTWQSMKGIRDALAKRLADRITQNPELLQRHERICDNLKDPYKRGFQL